MNEVMKIESTQLEENKLILGTCTEDDVLILYISDLHIDYKIKEKNPEEVINKIIDKLVKSIESFSCYNCQTYLSKIVVIAGDVSDNFEYFKKFFAKYIREVSNKIKTTIFVPGNHDVWNS